MDLPAGTLCWNALSGLSQHSNLFSDLIVISLPDFKRPEFVLRVCGNVGTWGCLVQAAYGISVTASLAC